MDSAGKELATTIQTVPKVLDVTVVVHVKRSWANAKKTVTVVHVLISNVSKISVTARINMTLVIIHPVHKKDILLDQKDTTVINTAKPNLQVILGDFRVDQCSFPQLHLL